MIRRDGHGLRLGSDLERGIDLQRGVRVDHDAGPPERFESLDLKGEVIRADGQLGQRIEAMCVGDDHDLRAEYRVHRRHGDARRDTTGRILDGP